MSEKSLSRRNLLGGSAGLAAGAVFMSALNPAAAAAPAVSDLAKTDPEYARFFKHFDEEEVAKTVEPVLGKAHRHFVILAALLGCGGIRGPFAAGARRRRNAHTGSRNRLSSHRLSRHGTCPRIRRHHEPCLYLARRKAPPSRHHRTEGCRACRQGRSRSG